MQILRWTRVRVSYVCFGEWEHQEARANCGSARHNFEEFILLRADGRSQQEIKIGKQVF